MKFTMSKTMKAVCAVAVAAVTLAATVDSAEARWRRGHHRGGWGGPGIAVGVLGGLATGAMIAGATSPAYAYPGYYEEPAYYTPAYTTYQPAYTYRRPVYRRYARSEPVCTVRRKRVWLSPNTYTFRRVTVCRR